MAVISRTPQQQVDIHSATLDLAQTIIEAIKNPGAIKESARLLMEANSISEQKRKELEEAEAIIAKAKNAMNDVDAAKNLHEENVKKSLAQIAKENSDLDAYKLSLDSQKIKTENDITFQKSDIEKQISFARNLRKEAEDNHKEADIRDTKNDARESAISSREKKLDKREFDANDRDKKLDERENKIAAREKKLRSALE